VVSLARFVEDVSECPLLISQLRVEAFVEDYCLSSSMAWVDVKDAKGRLQMDSWVLNMRVPGLTPTCTSEALAVIDNNVRL
jgi:hypothetical protein